jgi:hypothetical protein
VIAFLDASAVIYAVEGEAVWAEAVKRQLRQLAATAHASGGVLRLAVSRLSWLECRVGPLRRIPAHHQRFRVARRFPDEFSVDEITRNDRLHQRATTSTR